MLPDHKIKCPATGFARSCREIIAEHDCPKFISVKGHDPQSGAIIDRHGCADGFMPLLLIENAQMSRQVAASVDTLRAELKQADETATERAREALARIGRGMRLVGNG